MSALELYTNTIILTRGTAHLAALQALRTYLKLTPEQETIRYINMITDQEQLRALIEAGMRGDTYKATISRLNLLMKEQEEAKK